MRGPKPIRGGLRGVIPLPILGPMKNKPDVMLTCRIERPLLVALNLTAKKIKKTRSELIRAALRRIVLDAA